MAYPLQEPDNFNQENRQDALLKIHNYLYELYAAMKVLSNDISGLAVEAGDIAITANRLEIQDTVTPATDGSQTVFTTSRPYRTNTLVVFRDQSILTRGVDFTETTNTTFTLTSIPGSDEILRVSYIAAD